MARIGSLYIIKAPKYSVSRPNKITFYKMPDIESPK